MMKKTYAEPYEEQQEDARERYFDREDPNSARRKIKKEDLDALEWEELGDR